MFRKIKLGEVVTDSITGFTGVATARAEYLYGCVRVEITPNVLKDGQPVEARWFDEQRLISGSSAKKGGPQSMPQRKDPPRS